MSAQWKWVIGIVSIIVVFALLACGIFYAWRYFFGGKPSVEITAPPSNYQAPEGEEVIVKASATGRSIVKIELWVDDGLVDSASSPSPQDSFSAALTWQATGPGRHTVEVKAHTLAGRESDPAGIILIVIPAEVAEATPTATVEPSVETPTPTTPPTATPTSPPAATPTPTSPPPTATPTSPPPTATPTATPGPPVIEFFKADPETIDAGDSSTLSWGLVSGATSVEIDQGIGGVGTPGSTVVSPATTTTYTMTAVGAGGTATASVTLTVNPAAPTQIYNFVDHMCDATWKGGDSDGEITLPCPGPSNDNRGFVRAVGGMELEDGSAPAKAVETHPRWTDTGWIQGKYHLPWPIQAGDKFVAKVGFLKNAFVGSVKFMLVCSTNGTGGTAWQTTKPYNNSVVDVSVDLPGDCVGVSYLTLRVLADGNSSQDWAVWVNPRLVGVPR